MSDSDPEAVKEARKVIEARKAAIRADAEKRIAEADRDLADFERLGPLAAKLGFAVVPAAAAAAAAVPLNPASKLRLKGGRGGSRPKPHSVSARARTESEAIIRQLNRPVPLSELHEKVAARGVKFGGKNPSWQLSGLLGKVPALISTDRGWWLKGVPIPPESANGRAKVADFEFPAGAHR